MKCNSGPRPSGERRNLEQVRIPKPEIRMKPEFEIRRRHPDLFLILDLVIGASFGLRTSDFGFFRALAVSAQDTAGPVALVSRISALVPRIWPGCCLQRQMLLALTVRTR